MEIMIRKITAVVCVLVMVLAAIAPGTAVFAERTAACWDLYGAKSGDVKIENGVMTLDATSGEAARWTRTVTFNEAFTIKFSARILAKQTMGVQIFSGKYRSGFYLSEDRVTPHGQTAAYYAIGNDWHDYRIETNVDHQWIYIDNNLVFDGPTQPNSNSSSFFFWTNPGGKLQIGYFTEQNWNGKEIYLKTAAYAGKWLPGEDYTPAFHDDFKTDLGNWHLTDSPAVKWNKEEGTITLQASKGTSGGYYAMQHAVKFTKNFDWKWKMKIVRNDSGTLQFKYAGDGLNSYFYITQHNALGGAQYNTSYLTGKTNELGMGIPVPLGEEYGKWNDMELQRRGNYLTLLVNGGKIKTWRTYQGNVDPGLLSFSLESKSQGDAILVLGEQTYTPYMPTLDMVKPYYKSEYAQNTNVELQATASEAVDYIDYYVDGVKVGRGYAPDYTYVLENVQVGTYNICAGVADERSAVTTMKVTPAFSAELNVEKSDINYGGEVGVSITSDALNSQVAPTKAEYYVNGKLAATASKAPFKATLKDFEVGTAFIYAKVSNSQGSVIQTDSKYVNVSANNNDKISFNREYDMSYKYNSGKGEVTAEDGYFKLSIKNEGSDLIYLDQDGSEKTYSMKKYKDSVTGYGDYRIITTSGYAEVYYNGQMLTNFYMPRTQNKNKLSYSGITDFKMTGRNCKATLFHKDWNGEANYASEAINTGVYAALEFDKTDLSDEVIEFYDGRYQYELTFKDGKVYVRDQGKVGANIKPAFELENPAQVGYYRLNVTESQGQLWCDNKYIGSFVGPLYSHKPQVLRRMTNPSASTFVAVKSIEDIYYHSEDFSGNKELQALKYWLPSGDAKYSIENENGKYFTTLTGGKDGKLYLNAYTKNVDFSAKVKVDSASDFYMLERYFPIYYDTRLGYDFAKGVYYASYNIFGGQRAGKKERVEFPGEFETGVWHDIRVTTNETNLVMYVDGKKVIDTDLWMLQAGNSGFGVVGGSVSFTDVQYIGRGKVGAGALNVMDYENMGYHDFAQLKDGSVCAISIRGTDGNNNRYTTDNGKTWSEAKRDGRFKQTALLPMKDGRYCAVSTSSNDLYVQFSDDEGMTWYGTKKISERESGYRVVQNDFPRVAKDGTLLITTDECITETSGKIGIFYSHDNGETWQESETFLEETVCGVNMQEASLIDMPEEGHYRLFARTDRNYIYYWDSFDNLKTFEQMKPMPSPFKAAMCTFKVERDNYEDQTYYALWTYDSDNVWQRSYSCPRNRVALAVSYDGMKTWEFVQTILEIGDYPIGLVRNYSLDIYDDTLYISMNGISTEGFLMTIDKKNIKTTKRFEEVHQRWFMGGTTADEDADGLSVIPNKPGQAWILGNYEDVDVKDNKLVEASALAKAFKSTITKSGNTVTFKIGDGFVKFTDGSSSYDVNGTVTDFGAVCMKDGYVNIEACAKAFGKTITENKAQNGWVIWADLIYEDYFRQQLEGLI